MKKLSILLIAILFCSLQGHAQFWISFGWNEPHCQNCLWMEQAIRMTNRQAAEYHKIIHRYGEKIEREARKHYRYCVWNGTGNYSVSFRLRSFVCMCVSSVRHRHAFMTGEVGTIIRIIRTTVRPMRAIVMKIIIGIANGNIRTIDGLTVSTTANGIPVNMIVLNHIITMAVHIMTMGSGSHQGGRPGSDHHKNKHDKDKFDKKRPDRDKDRHYDRDKRSDKDRTNSRQRTSDRRSIEKSI